MTARVLIVLAHVDNGEVVVAARVFQFGEVGDAIGAELRARAQIVDVADGPPASSSIPIRTNSRCASAIWSSPWPIRVRGSPHR